MKNIQPKTAKAKTAARKSSSKTPKSKAQKSPVRKDTSSLKSKGTKAAANRVPKSAIEEIQELKTRLQEAEETIEAIRSGGVDALVVSSSKGEQLYTLKGAERPYRILVESMNEGALSLMENGIIISCNKAFAKIAGISSGMLIGRSLNEFVPKDDTKKYNIFWKKAKKFEAKAEIELRFGSRTVATFMSAFTRIIEGECWVFLIVTDISERKRSEAELDKYRHHLEQLVEEQTRQLHRTNDKLQAVNEELQTVNEELQTTNEELITTNEELVARTAEFEAVFGNMSDAVIYSDYSRNILMSNPAAEKLFGYRHDELVNIGIKRLYANRYDYERVGREKHALLNGQELKLPPIMYKRKDGTEFLGETITSSVITRHGLKGFIGIYRDITERTRIEVELQRLNKALRALSDSSQAIVRAENEQTYLNDVCKIIIEDCGYSMVWVGYAENDHEKSVRPVASAGFEEGYLETLKISWADTDRGRGPTGTAIRTGEVTLCRNILTDPSFTPWRNEALKRGYASSIVFPLFADSRVFGAVTIYSKEADPFSDNEIKLLTELSDNVAYGIRVLRIKASQKEAEEALRKSEERFRSFFNSTAVGAAELDLDGHFIRVNDQMCQLTGYSSEELLGMTPAELTHPDDRNLEDPRLAAYLRGEIEVYEAEKRYVRKDGQVIWVQVTAAMAHDASGRALRSAGVIQDITTRKNAESELDGLAKEMAARNLQLETLNKELDAFVYSVSHDLRAPLRIIEGFSKVLIDDYTSKLDQEGKKHLQRIRNGADRMSHLIEDLLRLSHISRQDLRKMDVDVGVIASSVIYNLRQANAAKDVEVVIKEGMRANVDPDLIQIAISNLLSNAWKFTSKTSKARIEFGSMVQNGKTVYYIRDNGAGFDQTYADKMFLPFQRLHSENEFEGTGVGLSIVERIISRHGGMIRAEGAVGKGATVYFTLG